MTIIRTGANQKYANGWEQAFGKNGKTAPSGKSTAKSASQVKSVAKSKPKSSAQPPAALKKKKQPSRHANKVARSK